MQLTHAVDASFGLPPSPSREALRWMWTLTFTDLQRDTKIIDKDEVVAGFGQAMWREEQGGPLDLFIRMSGQRHVLAQEGPSIRGVQTHLRHRSRTDATT